MKFCTVMLASCFQHTTRFHSGIDVWLCDTLTWKTCYMSHKQGKCLENGQCTATKLRSGASLSQTHSKFEPSLFICLQVVWHFPFYHTNLMSKCNRKKDLEAEVLQKSEIFLRDKTPIKNLLPLSQPKTSGQIASHWKNYCQGPS